MNLSNIAILGASLETKPPRRAEPNGGFVGFDSRPAFLRLSFEGYAKRRRAQAFGRAVPLKNGSNRIREITDAFFLSGVLRRLERRGTRSGPRARSLCRGRSPGFTACFGSRFDSGTRRRFKNGNKEIA